MDQMILYHRLPSLRIVIVVRHVLSLAAVIPPTPNQQVCVDGAFSHPYISRGVSGFGSSLIVAGIPPLPRDVVGDSWEEEWVLIL